MQLRVLGPLEVVGGPRRALGSDRQRVILAVLLAARGGVVSTDRLVDAVWGARPPPSARPSLHSHVSRLRRTLAAIAPDAPDVVVTETDGYRADLERHDLDADRFEDLLASARDDLRADPGRAIRRLDDALALWRGLAFGRLADHEFVRPEAVRLDELRAAAVADRVDARLAIGDHASVIGELEAQVAADPLADRPHGQLMLALYRGGRQADALAAYRRLQRRLRQELGVDPSPDVQRLHELILRQDADLPRPVWTPSPGHGRVATPRRDGGDPAPVVDAASSFLGRDDDVAAVVGLVTTSPVVTLTGPGGVGKSRLAEEVAAAVGEQFEDGVAVCGLAAVRDPASVTAAVVAALGIRHEGARTPDEALLTALGTRRLLLVLDNCEHVLAAVAAVVELVRGRCPQVAVLATSREYLHLPGERVWDVTPLPVPRAGAGAAEVAASPAGALFAARAQAVAPSFELTDDDAATIAELCRRLDGLPLALELAAARTRALSVDDLAARLDDRFALLTGGSHRDAGRHRTLEAVVAWSYGLLTEAEARLFDRLSVFAGPFSLAAAEQVCAGEPLDEREVAGLLAELVDKSLVTVERVGGEVRYALLDTLRAYGAQRLEDAGTAESTRHAHARYHVQLAEELGPAVRGVDEQVALARIDAAFDDLRLAQARLLAARDVDGALRLPAALHDDLTFRPRAEVFGWAERALALPAASDHPSGPAALATVARGAIYRGELARTRRLAEAALAGAEPDGPVALSALYLLTTTALYEGRLDDAVGLADRRLALAASLGDGYHRALAGVSRTLATMYAQDTAAAVAAATGARAAADASGNHTARAWALYASGEALLERDPDEAAALLEQAVDAARRVDAHLIRGVALVSLASVCGRIGETGRALALFRDAVTHWRRLGDYTHQLTTVRNLVELLVHVHADEPAAVLHGAVTAGATPTYGAEAARLAAARGQLAARLGVEAADADAERGRALTADGMVETALAALDRLLEGASRAGGTGRDG